MSALFDAVRCISSVDAARHAGLPLKQNGARSWTRCPFHGEKTASLCLYDEPERGWVCYGCHKGGDAVALYANLYNESRVDAAKRLAADFGIQVPDEGKPPRRKRPQPTVFNLQRALNKFRDEEYDKYCRVLHSAEVVLDEPRDPDKAWSDPRFLIALRARGAAETMLDWLYTADLIDLAEHFRNARCKKNELDSGRQGGHGGDSE